MFWKKRETPSLPPQPLESLFPENSRFKWMCRLITPASKVPRPPSSTPKGVGRCHKAWHPSAQSVLQQLGHASLCLFRFFPVKGLLVPDTTTLGSLCLWGRGKGGGGGGSWAADGKTKFKITRGVSWVPSPTPVFSNRHCSLGRAGFPWVPFIDRETEVLSQPCRSKSWVCRGQFKHFLHLQDPELDPQHEAGYSPNPGDTQIRCRSGWVCPSFQPGWSPLGSRGGGGCGTEQDDKSLDGGGILPWGPASGKPQGRSCPYQGCSAPTEGDSRGLWDVRPPASHPQASAGPTLPTHGPCHLLATPEAAPPPMEAP